MCDELGRLSAENVTTPLWGFVEGVEGGAKTGGGVENVVVGGVEVWVKGGV